MKVLNALVTREARAQRALVATAAVLTPLLVLAGQHSEFVDPAERDAWTLSLILPGTVVLLVLALIVDAFTRDFSSDVGESLDRLPVRPSRLVAAKCIWLSAVAAALYSWAFLTEGIAGFAVGGIPSLYPGSANHWEPLQTLALLALLGPAIGALTVWIRRPFVTCSCGVLLMLGAFALLRRHRTNLVQAPEVIPMQIVVALFAGALAWAAVRSFQAGHLLPGERVRRIARGLAVLVPVTGAVALAQWAGAPHMLRGTIGEMSISEGHVSPDGRQALVYGVHPYESLIGSREESIQPWVLDIESGETIGRVPDGYWPDWGDRHWSKDGRLQVMAWSDGKIAHWDPVSGELEQTNESVIGRRKVRRAQGVWQVQVEGEWLSPNWRTGASPLLSVIPGRAYERAPDGAVIQHDLLAGTSKELHTASPDRPQAGHGIEESPDGSVLLVKGPTGESAKYIDAATGVVIHELAARWFHAGWTGGRECAAFAEPGPVPPRTHWAMALTDSGQDTHPIAFARHPDRWSESTIEYRFLTPSGMRSAQATRLHSMQAIEGGQFAAFDGSSMWIVDESAQRLRPVYIPSEKR